MTRKERLSEGKVAKESDKEVLRRIMSEPTFEKVAEAARREHKRREEEIKSFLRETADNHAAGRALLDKEKQG